MIDTHLFDEITAQAEASLRLRMNYNIHESLKAPCQRLINVLLPVHRHRNTAEIYGLRDAMIDDEMGMRCKIADTSSPLECTEKLYCEDSLRKTMGAKGLDKVFKSFTGTQITKE